MPWGKIVPGTHCTGSWVKTQTGMEKVKKKNLYPT
jgi:hypothetical protein